MYVLFCSGMLNRIRCDVLHMECHAYDNGRWLNHSVQFLNVTQNLLKNVVDVIPYCGKVVDIVPPCNMNDMLSNYIRHAPCLPILFMVTCPWLLTDNLLLDVFHNRISQDLPPLEGRSHRKSNKTRVLNNSIPLDIHMYDVCSFSYT